MAGSFWETACQPNPSRFRLHSLPWMERLAPEARAVCGVVRVGGGTEGRYVLVCFWFSFRCAYRMLT